MHQHSLRWLWLGVGALAVAGVFAIILVAARTPQLAMFSDLFSVALVVHVDLSVLLWFLCIGCLGWSQFASAYAPPMPYWQSGGFYTIAAATALIALSPLDPHWEVVKSNYIPVLDNILFLAGLGFLAAGLMVVLLPVLSVILSDHWRRMDNEQSLFAFAAIPTILALAAFFFSARLLPEGLPVTDRFEELFWAGGHVLQFSFTLLMMAGWVALIETLRDKPVSKGVVRIAAFICVLAAVKSCAGFVKYPFDSGDFTYYQTRIMIDFGGLGAGILALAIISRLCARGPKKPWKTHRAYFACLIVSILLFTAGGSLGMLIQGQNTIIPAHYHGAIVGITLSLMGYAYVLLPRYGYPSVAGWRLAFWQPIVYGVGQLMHIGGLAYSGGYGVLRKTPAGETPNLAPDVKAALGFMGLGGLFAIIGGLLFVVVMVLALRAKRRVKQSSTV